MACTLAAGIADAKCLSFNYLEWPRMSLQVTCQTLLGRIFGGLRESPTSRPVTVS